MSKSLVDRYEQILAEDPASTVFVELAKALIDRGEHAKAIDVCKTGLSHHTNSVVARVLWGKALINTGKASEAMNQFDLAMKIDRENPHAYNLISEVLLHKGLYRSALPILRKAAALQPNDGRVQTWLEQTKSALSGGPKPVLVEDHTRFDEQKAEEAASRPMPRPIDDEALPTVVMSAYDPDGRSAPTGEFPTQDHPVGTNGTAAAGQSPSGAVGRSSATQVLAAQKPEGAPEDPFDAMNQSKGDSDLVVQGLTSTFDALQDGAGQAFEVPLAPPPVAADIPPPPAPGVAAPLGGMPDEPSVVPNLDLYGAPPEAAGGKLLDDVVSMVMPIPAEVRKASAEAQPAPAPAAAVPAPRPSGGGLLDEIPDFEEPPAHHVEAPKAALNTQATDAIAREYERELREKLAKKQAQKTFLQRNGGKLIVIGLVLVGLAGVGGFLLTRSRYGGKDLPSTIAEARTAINSDTRLELQRGLAALDNAAKMDVENAEVWALTGFAHAVLYGEHGGDSAQKQKALEALARPRVRDEFPELALVSDWLLAEGPRAVGAKQAIIASQLNKTDVHAAAGRILLDDGKPDEALKRLTRATELLKQNVRALVALGDYYLEERDHEAAYKFFNSEAARTSPVHPGRLLGLAEARLELGKEQAESLAEIEKLTHDNGLPAVLAARREMVYARLLASQDRNAEGIKVLEVAAKEYGGKGFEVDMGFGVAWKSTGQMKAAQEGFEAALKKNPGSEDAKEGLGRVLLARFRERELLGRLPDADSKRISMVRGIAQVRLGEWKKARAEFAKTQTGNKYPAEAVTNLALADAAEGEAEKAQKLLEKVLEKLGDNPKRRTATLVALGKVYWQRGDLKKARAALEDAASDPFDSDGNAILGELVLSLGLPDAALEPLKRAVERNSSHGPARHHLVRTLLALGQYPDALKHAEAGAEDNPGSTDAWKDLALALLRNGKSKEAVDAVGKMIKPDTTDSEAFRIKAQVLFARADGRQAFSALERSNKLNPKDAETFCEIAFAFYRQGAADTAVAAYGAAQREDSKSVCGQVGPFHAKPFGGKQAAEKLLELATKAPHAWDKAFALATAARVQLSFGQLKEARENSDKALELAPFGGAAHFAAGEVAKRQKDEPRALDEFGKAVLYEPSWGAARLALADALLRSGDENLPKAIAEYETFLVVSQSEGDVRRVKSALPGLKKKAAKK